MIQRARVLIVEDNTMIADYLASVLEARGFRPVHALTLAQARQRLQSEPAFDLCLCDRWLPDGEGTALIVDLSGTPAVAMSAHLDNADCERLQAAGFAKVLLKPCSPEVLYEALHAVLGPPRSVTSGAAITSPDPAAQLPVLDDTAALRMSGGDCGITNRLRSLLLAELPAIRQRLLMPDPDHDQRMMLAAELHKLAASAGWCGASELAAGCERLRCALSDSGDYSIEQADLVAAVDRLCRALAANNSAPT